jgi:polyisoprenoid-binding protein YceI
VDRKLSSKLEEYMMATITQMQTGIRTIWDIDPAHTLVEFATKHMMVSTVKGRFPGVRGTITFDEENPVNSSVEVEIDAATIDTRNEQRDAHLRSADFLDIEHYPTIIFKSTRIERIGEERARVYGDLTIRGVTREVVLDTTFNGRGTTPFGQEVIGFSAETTINRHDFGLNWNVALEAGGWLVGDKVKVTLEVEAIRRQAE